VVNLSLAAQGAAEGIEVDRRRFHVGITGLQLTSQAWVLVEALPLLLIGAQVLAHPGPELGAGGGAALAEVHQVAPTGHPLDLHLTEGAALAGARGDRSHARASRRRQLRANAARACAVIRVLQLSDPHLLADPKGLCRGRESRACLQHGWEQALAQLGQRPDLLLISGDLCQDESWGGYVRLRQLLDTWAVPVALLPGNHDHGALLRAALGRQAWIAPARVPLEGWTLLLLSSHRPGAVEGWIAASQLDWLRDQLALVDQPLVVALHHPPVAIGSPELDSIALQQPQPLLDVLLASPWVRGLVFGHVHQHWHGSLARPSPGLPLPLWGCPSTLAAFPAAQPCPLGQPTWPGGRWLELAADGGITTRLLRWPPWEPA
jgi:Icc protein